MGQRPSILSSLKWFFLRFVRNGKIGGAVTQTKERALPRERESEPQLARSIKGGGGCNYFFLQMWMQFSVPAVPGRAG